MASAEQRDEIERLEKEVEARMILLVPGEQVLAFLDRQGIAGDEALALVRRVADRIPEQRRSRTQRMLASAQLQYTNAVARGEHAVAAKFFSEVRAIEKLLESQPGGEKLAPADDKPLSVRAYAKHRGCTHQAVRKAIADGRLVASIVHVDGKPKISSAAVADAEWDAATRQHIDTNPASSDYAKNRARKEAAQAEIAELELAERKRLVLPIAEIREQWIAAAATVKTKLLGLPTRIRQRLPHIEAGDIREIAGLIRQALEELADGVD